MTFAEHYGLKKSQAELDFVNVPLDEDIPLFIDPFAIAQRPERWTQNCSQLINSFFQKVIDHIRSGDLRKAKKLLLNLSEPNETRFGYSSAKPKGAGIGSMQADQLLDALSQSEAVKTGFLSHLEEAELMIRGVGRDKISDLTTNVIRKPLSEYTKQQCDLHGIATSSVALAPYFDGALGTWRNDYYNLPVVGGSPVLLVPKVIARYSTAYDHQSYYRHFVLNFLRAEELSAGSSLVNTLKDGRRKVYKKDVEAKYPLSKEFLFEFSKAHPEVLEDYREQLALVEKKRDQSIGRDEERALAQLLAKALDEIPGGGAHADTYHNLMVGVLEFLFHPDLLNPVKEDEIHQGRKRIDIKMENGATEGTLHRLHDVRKLPCAFVSIECKNYTTEIANPELDQLAGRFSANRGKFGILCCRQFENRARFIERCRDTLGDDRGLIVPFDDATVKSMLGAVEDGKRRDVDRQLNKLINEVWT